MPRKNILYNQPLEDKIGFSRAVRIGNVIAVSGTAPIAPDGGVASIGDTYGQTQRCLEIIKDVLEKAGGKIEDVVRTRVFLKNITDWQDVARAHGEMFTHIKPVCTFVEVKGFIHPDWLVEIEVDAIISNT